MPRRFRNPASQNLRQSFWLHDVAVQHIHVIDTAALFPKGYHQLTDTEKLTVAEFIEFLMIRRSDDPCHQRQKFFLRDHSTRPQQGHTLNIDSDTPEKYDALSVEERFHVHEIIQFLIRRRTLRNEQ